MCYTGDSNFKYFKENRIDTLSGIEFRILCNTDKYVHHLRQPSLSIISNICFRTSIPEIAS